MILYNDDCFNILPKIDSSSIDLILTDLPYGTTSCSWDSILPLDQLWNEFNRLRKPNTAIVFTASQPFTTILINSNFNLFKYELIWEKNIGTNYLNAKKQPLKMHENICVFYEKQCYYNPIMSIGKKYSGSNSSKRKNGDVYGFNKRIHEENYGTRYPTSILKFQRKKEEGFLHPTQKPIELLSYLIKTYSNVGDIVLDCCMGSGTTGVSAKINNRKFIGIEKDLKYFEIAKDRINNCGKLNNIFKRNHE